MTVATGYRKNRDKSFSPDGNKSWRPSEPYDPLDTLFGNGPQGPGCRHDSGNRLSMRDSPSRKITTLEKTKAHKCTKGAHDNKRDWPVELV